MACKSFVELSLFFDNQADSLGIRLKNSLAKELQSLKSIEEDFDAKYNSSEEGSIKYYVTNYYVLSLLKMEDERKRMLAHIKSFEYLTKFNQGKLWEYYE